MKKFKGLRKDQIREASRRLGTVLKNSQKLGVSEVDLGSLPAVEKLCSSPRRGSGIFLTVGLLVTALFLLAICTDLPSSLTCHGNSSTETSMIHTVRKTSVDMPDSSKDYEDTWLGSQVNLRRDR
ncbi:uncharacterized protein LOC142321049 [Lycorma delicatula]|uniref:uncharacterized protein LOC142321049 n=1 Tax=Lycorma delicatula TaxID=130591 RepID=UPI003F518C0F